jgi:hypothetical protein
LFNISAWSVNSDILFQDPQGADPYIKSPDLYLDASVSKYLNITIANNGQDGNLEVFFKNIGDTDYSPGKKFPYPISFCARCGNAPFVTYKIPIYQNFQWTGKITGIRIDPTTAGAGGTSSDTIGYQRIWFSTN